METITPTKFPFQKELIALIKKELPLHSIYVISEFYEINRRDIYLTPVSKNPQELVVYTLLIIGHKSPSKNQEEFMESLYSKLQKRCKVYTIFHTLSNIKNRIYMGDNFLTRTLSKTPCMYRKDNDLFIYSHYQLFFDRSIYKKIKQKWKIRMRRAEYLLSVVNIIDEKEDANSKLAIMHLALEQVCLSLLTIFWEYKPQHYALAYLMHLCSHFTQLPNKIFPQTTFGLQRQYYMLCNASNIMRFKGLNEFSNKDADKVYKLCKRFYEESKTLGRDQLKLLKELHCQQDLNPNPKK